MLANIKNKVLNILIRLISPLVIPVGSNTILIVRLDAIGDYILFRNYLDLLKKSSKYNNKKIVLLGNPVFKSIAESFDSNVIDEFIWISPQIIFGNDLPAKVKLIIKLKLYRFDLVINPVHSRIWAIDHFISKVGAKQIIGSKGDDNNFESKEQYALSSKFYDKLFAVPGVSEFEFYRNRAFFQRLTGLNDDFPILSIPFERKSFDNHKSIVIVPGAGEPFRRWSTINFASTINKLYIELNFNLIFEITGTIEEAKLAEEIIFLLAPNIRVHNLAGKLSLTQLVDKIASADLLLSNETSAVHIAAATGTSTICISNGNHFGRFNPYPLNLAKHIATLYPDNRFYNQQMKGELIYECRYQSKLDINKVKFTDVVNKSIEFLGKNSSRSINLKA